jgi:hypothetical protein
MILKMFLLKSHNFKDNFKDVFAEKSNRFLPFFRLNRAFLKCTTRTELTLGFIVENSQDKRTKNENKAQET